MAGRIADRQQDRPVGGSGLGEGGLSPGAPMNRIVAVLAQIGTGLLVEKIALGQGIGHGGASWARERSRQNDGSPPPHHLRIVVRLGSRGNRRGADQRSRDGGGGDGLLRAAAAAAAGDASARSRSGLRRAPRPG